jgi:predicted homoserine dehydrogenase-like protein
MDRRRFLYTSAAGLAWSAAGFADDKPRRVGLIGPGWYGKCDLFRLIQVSPVEVVSLCDVDNANARARRRPGGHAPEIR